MRYFIWLILAVTIHCHAATWYVDNEATGGNSGTNWLNAWSDMSFVSWGGSGVVAGDTIYISGGSISKTYTNTWTVGASGTAANLITIKPGIDDGHSGAVNFDGARFGLFVTNTAVVGLDRNYIKFERLNFINWRNLTNDNMSVVMRGNPATGNQFLSCVFSNVNTAIYQVSATNTVVGNCYIFAYGDAAIALLTSRARPGNEFDSHLIYSNTIRCAWNAISGGPDGVQSRDGVTMWGNLFECVSVPDTNSANHVDFLQSNGGWTRVFNNEFLNIGDSGLSPSPWTEGDAIHDVHIYNNVFRITEQMDIYPNGIRMYCTPGLAYFSNVMILNNLFVDFTNASTVVVYISGADEMGISVGTNNVFANNMFVNCGAGNSLLWKWDQADGAQSPWSITNNILHSPNGRVQFMTNVYTTAQWMAIDPNVPTNLPSFVRYAPLATNNDFNLMESDSVARNAGLVFNNLFTNDFAWQTRGDTWDIGAYEFSGESPSPPVSGPGRAHAGRLKAGVLRWRTQ